MALALPGLGYDLLHIIKAPALQDLQMDGIRDDARYVYAVSWMDSFPERLHTALRITASCSPELRRLSLVGAYLARDTWEWLLGCDTQDLPFPTLYSIAVHQLQSVKDEVTNTLDDALLELYAHQGRLMLHRFAYLASDPPLRGIALDQLIKGVARRQDADQIFELELDGVFDLDAEDRDILLSQGVNVILHEESPQKKSWWTLGKDIDPAESNSY